jgi:hypothetical protein
MSVTTSIPERLPVRLPFRIMAGLIVFCVAFLILMMPIMVWKHGPMPGNPIKDLLMLPLGVWFFRLCWYAMITGKLPTNPYWPFFNDKVLNTAFTVVLIYNWLF